MIKIWTIFFPVVDHDIKKKKGKPFRKYRISEHSNMNLKIRFPSPIFIHSYSHSRLNILFTPTLKYPLLIEIRKKRKKQKQKKPRKIIPALFLLITNRWLVLI